MYTDLDIRLMAIQHAVDCYMSLNKSQANSWWPNAGDIINMATGIENFVKQVQTQNAVQNAAVNVAKSTGHISVPTSSNGGSASTSDPLADLGLQTY